MTHATFMTRRNQVLCLAAVLVATCFALAQDASVGAPPLTLQPGTVLTIRVNEALSSDHNQSGDLFSGSLTQPVVVQGIVLAQRGQTVAGRVVEAKKAGMVSGVSQLRLSLTRLTLADGQSVPIRTQMAVRNGRTSERRDIETVVGTTGLGTVLGAAIGRGRGTAIGAAAGAATGTAGVLLTRGYQTVIYPETVLTFELTAPVDVDTSYAPQAFHAVNTAEYAQAAPAPAPPQAAPAPMVAAPPVVVAAPPYGYPYPYGPYVEYEYPYYPYPYVYPYPYYYRRPAVSVFFGHPVFLEHRTRFVGPPVRRFHDGGPHHRGPVHDRDRGRR